MTAYTKDKIPMGDSSQSHSCDSDESDTHPYRPVPIIDDRPIGLFRGRKGETKPSEPLRVVQSKELPSLRDGHRLPDVVV